MLLHDYIESCMKFAADTKDWAKLDYYKYYTATQNGNWEESCDNVHGGLNVDWAFLLSESNVMRLAPDFFVKECRDKLISLIDNNVDYDTLRKAIDETMEV